MSTAAQQNAMMLASLLGVGEADATERLKRLILITAEPGWKSAWAREVGALASRTVEVVFDQGDAAPDLELVVGVTAPRSRANTLFADLGDRAAAIACAPVGPLSGKPHGLQAAAAACATTAAAIYTVLAASELPS